MNKNPGRRLAILGGLIVLIGIGFASFSYIEANKVPSAFQNAREEGAVISARIVENSKSLATDLSQLSDLEKHNNYAEANKLIDSLVDRNKSIRADALDLSNKLQDMTKAISGIKSDDAKSAALTGVNSDLSLISHLLDYSDLLQQLFAALRASQYNHSQDQHIKDLIDQINGEVGQINLFNAASEDAFKKFDNLTK